MLTKLVVTSYKSDVIATNMKAVTISVLILIYLRNYILAEVNHQCISSPEQQTNTSRCITFDDVVKDGLLFQSSLTLTIDGLVKLYFPLYFSDLWEISLIGQNNGTISCYNNSGVSFMNVSGLTMKYLTFKHCGLLSNSTSTKSSDNHSNENRTNWQSPSAVYIERCSNITIEKSVFANSSGVGLSVYDPTSLIDIQECEFVANRILTEVDTLPGGGGLHIELTSCAPGIYSHNRSNCGTIIENRNISFTIRRCKFENNNATTALRADYVSLSSGIYQRFGRGGGLLFIAEGNASFNQLKLVDCIFNRNSAQWGGGMLILFTGLARNNSVIVHNCTFSKNVGRNGGGGVYIQSNHAINGTIVEFKYCNFSHNSAVKIGGGLIFLSKVNHQLRGNKVSFLHCNWWSNSARYSAAVDLTRTERSSYTSDALILQFVNCSFVNNYVTNSTRKIQDSSVTYTEFGRGTFMTLYITIIFETYVCFENNTGSALYLISSNATFSSGITAIFRQNHGINGGAFCFIASSFMNIDHNSTFDILNNTASSVGGAIYFSSIGEHELHDKTHNCMFNDIENIENLQINFSGNRQHDDETNSVFSSPLSACVQNCSNNGIITGDTLLLCNSSVTFDDYSDSQIQGVGININLINLKRNLSESLKVFPGIKFDLPFFLIDERSNKQVGSFTVEITEGNIKVDKDYVFSIGKQMMLIGKSSNRAKLHFRRRNHRSFGVTFDVELLPCPPGLYFDSDANKCVCRIKGVSIYHMIRCGSGGQKALIVFGFWAGYVGNTTPNSFYTAICPPGFCEYNWNNTVKSLYPLPHNLSSSSFMCGSTRTGILCGNCTEGHSVYYHSPTLECKEDKLCKFGWLFYIASDILPLTAFFVVIIVFNISFTSGTANGFIFYSQVINTLAISSYGITGINLSSKVKYLTETYMFIYRCFNMEFFTHNHLSFCLWKGATTLGIIVFTYITIIYAFLLIVLTVTLMKYCSRCCLRWPHQWKMKSYAIHGLSTFLIMCYVRCTNVSFQILTSSSLIGARQVYTKHKRVFYCGNYEYFDKHHVIYAIPALVCIVIIVVTPPLLLLWYPLGPKLLQKCGLGDSIALKLSSRLIPQHKIQPFLDSFQSCYRDECRFFSGLYFLYRMSILAAFAGAAGLDQFYTSVQVLLVAMLVLHAIAQPYKNWWHNVSDALILAILSGINAFSVYIFSQQTRLDEIAKRNILYASTFQLILVYLPLISVLIYGTSKVMIIIKARCRCKDDSNEADELTDFPARLIYSDDESNDKSDTDVMGNRYKSQYIRD